MPVSYFTAVIAADGRAWRARDVDVEDAGSLDDLAETLRAVAHSEKPVLAVIEHEDEWFALVRVDGDEDARVFVSDLAAAARGPYAEILSSAGEVDTGVVVDDDGEVPPAAAAPADEPTQPTGGVGDLDGLLDEADDDGDLPRDVPDGEIPTGRTRPHRRRGRATRRCSTTWASTRPGCARCRRTTPTTRPRRWPRSVSRWGSPTCSRPCAEPLR